MRKLSLVGETFGRLTVIGEAPGRSNKSRWECLCFCGKIKVVAGDKLTSGWTVSCGCAKQVDLTGKRFERLYVVGRKDERDGSGCVFWHCRCDCGNEIQVVGVSLTRGNTRSCGCLQKERFTNRTHGMSGHPLYGVWTGMLQRCFNHKDRKYPDYGGRGIGVCDEWRRSFQAFAEWSLANGYAIVSGKGRLTIDRRDNDLGYAPDNCRWVTYAVQNGNRRPYRAS